LAIELASELTIDGRQVFKLLPAGGTGGEMGVRICHIRRGYAWGRFRPLTRFLEQFGKLSRVDMLVGISFQN
jgi:hypothetical protein